MRTNGANEAEFEFYKKEVDKLNTLAIHDELIALKILHHKIWDLEDDFKKCRIDGTDLAEVGRRALEIRDYNNTRVALKNEIAKKLGDLVKEIKA